MMRDLIGQQLGNYRLVKLLGRGGFAEVYLGQHVQIDTQQAAIKILYLTGVDPHKFRQEAQTIASLKHPNIIRLFDFSDQQDMPYLVMDYAPNGSLGTCHVAGEKVPLATVVRYVTQITSALQYAHGMHIIHRDIKPDNVLLGSHSELLLSDFGIAVLSKTGRATVNAPAGTAGTPYYMAPEMFRGKPDKASDQYALAVMVYQWLSGTLPFSEGDFIQLGYQHAHEPVPPLHERAPLVSGDVEAVVMKALAKDLSQRFASVQAFATALEQASQSKPLTPQPNPAPSESTSPSAVSTILAPSKKPIQTPRNVDTPAVQSLSQVVASTATPSDSQTRPQSPTSQRPTPRNRPALQPQFTRRKVLIGLVATGGVAVGGGITWFAISQRPISIPAHRMTPTSVPTLAPTPLPIGTLLFTYKGHSSAVSAVAWSPDGKHIASGSWDKTVQVWDAVNGGNVSTYKEHSSKVYAVAWSPDGKRIASGGDDHTVQVWDAVDGSHVIVYKGHSYAVLEVAWSPDGKRIASGSLDKTVQVWNAADGGNAFTYQGHSDVVLAVEWSPDGKRIASGSYDNTVQVWDVVNGGHVFTYRGHSSSVKAVAWSPDGKRIASSSWDKTVQVWDAEDGGHVFTYRGHSDEVLAVAWSPDGKRIASGSLDKTVQVWDAEDGGHAFTYRGHSNTVISVVWPLDGKRIASASYDETVQVWVAS
jgi:WD40 repeat protein